ERACVGAELQDAARDGAQGEQAAAQLGVRSARGAACRETLEESHRAQWPQLVSPRLGSRDQQVSQLAETSTPGVDRAFAGSDKRLQGLALAAGAWCRRPFAGQHAARGADRVQCVGLAAASPLAPQPADLEHLLATAAQEAGQPSTEGAGAFDREGAPTRRILVGQPERLRVALAA